MSREFERLDDARRVADRLGALLPEPPRRSDVDEFDDFAAPTWPRPPQWTAAVPPPPPPVRPAPPAPALPAADVEEFDDFAEPAAARPSATGAAPRH